MKFIRLLTAALLIAVFAGTAWAADFAPVEAPTSFRGLAWGTPLADIPELLAINKPGFKDSYFRKDERLTFADTDIVSVTYYFHKDKLYRAGVAFTGRAAHFLIKDRLIKTYGPGRGVGTKYGWMWPNFSVELTYDDDAKSGALYYTYEGKLD